MARSINSHRTSETAAMRFFPLSDIYQKVFNIEWSVTKQSKHLAYRNQANAFTYRIDQFDHSVYQLHQFRFGSISIVLLFLWHLEHDE